LGYALLNRMAEALIAGWGVVRDPFCLRFFWLYPARDLLGFLLWCASFVGTTITWRGERYRLEPGGRMLRCGASAVLNDSPVMSNPARVSET
jgi:ceramide glucosyltransferase